MKYRSVSVRRTVRHCRGNGVLPLVEGARPVNDRVDGSDAASLLRIPWHIGFDPLEETCKDE